jgi:flagellar biogenesis protein FliO
MHAVVRCALWLAMIGLAATAWGQAGGEYPDRYSQAPPITPENPQEIPHDNPSPWPTAPTNTGGSPPRVLPEHGAAPQPFRGEVRRAGGVAAAPAPVESNTASPPIPLSRKATDSSRLDSGELRPMASTAASLGLVVGVFLLVMWVVRRGMPKGSGLLPSDAVEVLGRTPLVGRQQVHLLRCGNKLVLVTITPSGTQTLTEVSDPAEVDRLVSLCQGGITSGSLRSWLGFSKRGREYRERPDDVDFRHLEIGQHRG